MVLWIFISVSSAWWSCLRWVPTQWTERCTWKPPVEIQSTSAIKLISYKVDPQLCVWEWFYGEENTGINLSGFVGRWTAAIYPGGHSWSVPVSIQCSPRTAPGYCHACNSFSSVPGVGIVHSQATPALKKCHSLCTEELLMLTDDSPLGRSELYCVPAEEKGFCYLRSSWLGIKTFQLMLDSRILLRSGLRKDFCLVSIYCIRV